MNTDYNEFLQLPHTKAEVDWMEKRLSTLSAKESIILAAARERYPPETAVDAINLLVSLQDYGVFSPAADYEGLGKFYIEEAALKLPEMVLAHTNMAALGEAFEGSHPGLFVRDCYVAYPNTPEQKPYDGTNLATLQDKGWSVKLKLASPSKPEGVWLRLPDYSEANDGDPDEVALALQELGVQEVTECTILDARCILPEAGDLAEQYDDPVELIYDGDSLGFLLDERAQGMQNYEEKLAAAMEYDDCRTLTDVIRCATNIGEYSFIMANQLEEYAKAELIKSGVPTALVDGGVFDLEGFAKDSLEKNGYRLDRTESVYLKSKQHRQTMEAGESAITRQSEHIVDENGEVLLSRVWNGFTDLEEAGWEVQTSEMAQESVTEATPQLEM